MRDEHHSTAGGIGLSKFALRSSEVGVDDASEATRPLSMAPVQLLASLVLALFITACGDDSTPSPDAAGEDAAAGDAESGDTALFDAARVDPPSDVGTPLTDAGPMNDSAASDTRPEPDAGPAPAPFLSEAFDDADLAARGWSRSLTHCAAVPDAVLGRDVIECRFEPGTSSPVGGNDSSRFFVDEPLNEVTLRFKQWLSSGYELGQTIHGFMGMSAKDEYSPANSHLSVYFEPSNNGGTPGEWALKIQDNRNMNCDFDHEELLGVSEVRSVGGCQQMTQRDESIRPWCWGNPCQGGLGDYTGQSGWTAVPTLASRPVPEGEWVEVVFYMRLNTPGEFDGESWIAVRHMDDESLVPVQETTRFMTRTSGPSADVALDMIFFGPWASGNTNTFQARFADLDVWRGDVRNELRAGAL